MKLFLISCICFIISGVFVGCGNNDSAANDINRLFDDVMPDGLEMTTDSYIYDGENNYNENTYGKFGNYDKNGEEYQYNNNYNNVYGTAPGDFNRAGYNNSGTGNMDFDITPSDFQSEK